MATLKNTCINDTGYLKLPIGTTAQRPASPQAGYMRYNTTESSYEAYDGSAWKKIDYDTTVSVQYLVVAGGGGGGHGGGGAGGYRSSALGENSGGGSSAEQIIILQLNTNYSVSIGSGGVNSRGITVCGTSGNNSSFGIVTSNGGGRGGSVNSVDSDLIGGSGGGSGGSGSSSNGSAGISLQGYAGGNFIYCNSNQPSAGGGGAGSVGQNNNSSTSSGNGGSGITSCISGTSVARAGGGGGGSVSQTSGTATAGGGNGAMQNPVGNSGTINTGGGGGGNGFDCPGGSGGSGIVILRYPNTATLCVGAGLSSTCLNCAVGTNERYTCITLGTGNVCWV